LKKIAGVNECTTPHRHKRVHKINLSRLEQEVDKFFKLSVDWSDQGVDEPIGNPNLMSWKIVEGEKPKNERNHVLKK
jgi:hypothetical protein